ncbi:MAG: mandelate racemase/muconate lactonizing enzyme family protein [Thermomicrobiales bacterium]
MDAHIVRIEYGVLEGRRPRHAGSNARIGDHGLTVHVRLARLTTDDGAQGFGVFRGTREDATAFLGTSLADAFHMERGVPAQRSAWDYPLWDVIAKSAGQPVYALAAAINGQTAPAPYRAPCYDTSLYFDDLHLASDDEAAALIAAEAREGYDRGHRAFKIKVGRGARYMPLEAGTRRDIAVVKAVREAVGTGLPIMLDANNGYNLNLTKHVLAETAACGIFWMEEPFHEDPMLYEDLRGWLERAGLPILIADGEGDASTRLLDWARDGIIDVVQYDIFSHGFTRWLATGKQLDGWNARSAPHHYGGHIGNFIAAHLAGAIRGFTYVEWDEVTTPGLDASGYVLRDGWVSVPNAPGFGLTLDEAVFQRAVTTAGFIVAM